MPRGITYAPWVPPEKPKRLQAWGSKRANKKLIHNASDDAAWQAGYRFHPGLVQHFLDFCAANLTFVRGSWTGQPVTFLQWQVDEIIGPILGWVHRNTYLRRTRRAYVELTKKQGKTTLAACLCLYGLLADGEGGARVISNGPTHMQAGLSWDIAADMIDVSPTLKDCCTLHRAFRKIRVPNIQMNGIVSTSEWSALAHSSGARGSAQGVDASMTLNDELHEWPSFDHWEQVTKAGRARRQPLMLSITNAGKTKEGPCWPEHVYAAKVLNSEVVDVTYQGFVRQTNEQEAEDEIDAVGQGGSEIPIAEAANPAIGTIVNRDEVIQDIRTSYATPGSRGNCLRLTYSVWRTFGDTPWIGHKWDDCGGSFSVADLVGSPCWCGLDVASVSDFTAAAYVFEVEPRERYRAFVRFWISQERMRELVRFVPDMELWWKAGAIDVNDGATTDHRQVRDDLIAMHNRFSWQAGNVRHIPQLIYDPRMADVITSDVAEATGCTRVEFTQTSQNYHHPCEILEQLVGDQRIEHDGNPLLKYHATNVRVSQNSADHKRPVRPSKDGDPKTIDGIVALIMALSQSDRPLPRHLDYYEHNEVEVI